MTDADDAMREAHIKNCACCPAHHDSIGQWIEDYVDLACFALHTKIDRAIEAEYTKGRMVGDQEGYRRAVLESEMVIDVKVAEENEACAKHLEHLYWNSQIDGAKAADSIRARISKEET